MGPPAGGSLPEPAGGDGTLLVVERSAVHVAGLPIGFAAEAQDSGVVDEAVGDGHGLSGRRQEFPPVLQDDERLLADPPGILI